MTSSQMLPGSFPRNNAFKSVALDFPRNGVQSTNRPDRTNGILANVPVGIGPTQSGHWEVGGFNVTARIAINVGTLAPGFLYWGRFGKLWAGVMIDQPTTSPGPLLNWPAASFPSDLSTFDPIWDGETDPIVTVNVNTQTDDRNYTLLSKLYMLPFPKTVKPGTQLSFALIWTPSTLDPILSPMIRSCDFAVHYSAGGGN